MSKIIITATVFVALLISGATATAVNIFQAKVDGPGPSSEECKEKIQVMEFKECMIYISQGSPYDHHHLAGMRMVIMINRVPILRQCCGKLENVLPEPCRCEVIKEIMKKMMEQKGQEEQKMEQMLQKAKYLTKTCYLQPYVCPLFNNVQFN